MNQDEIAVIVLRLWLLLWGFEPIDDFDPNDPNCRREYGPHVVYTYAAKAPEEGYPCIENLYSSFEQFLDDLHPIIGMGFIPYALDFYYHNPNLLPHMLYASIAIG